MRGVWFDERRNDMAAAFGPPFSFANLAA